MSWSIQEHRDFLTYLQRVASELRTKKNKLDIFTVIYCTLLNIIPLTL